MKKKGTVIKRSTIILTCALLLSATTIAGCTDSNLPIANTPQQSPSQETANQITNLNTDAATSPAATLPGDLTNLPSIQANPWVQVCDSPECEGLEGPAFDKDGNLYVCHLPHGDANPGIFKITPDGTVSNFYELQGPPAVTIAIHKDGRIFAGVVTGEILVLDTEGNLLETLKPIFNGQGPHIDDMVFDGDGSIYLTHFAGDVTKPDGAVLRLEATDEYKTATPIAEGLVGPNGLSLSPDCSVLWVSESTGATILRVGLNEEGLAEGRTPDSGIHPVYFTTGMNGPDSNKTDVNNNLYQVMFGTGRAVILNDRGIPITNLIINGSENGEMLFTTNLAIEPAATNGVIVAGGKTGGWVCKFEALEKGTTLYSHK